MDYQCDEHWEHLIVYHVVRNESHWGEYAPVSRKTLALAEGHLISLLIFQSQRCTMVLKTPKHGHI